jgi:hypothetical protein
LVERINRRPYCAVSSEEHIDGAWLKMAVYVPVGYQRGLALVVKIVKLFFKCAWEELA